MSQDAEGRGYRQRSPSDLLNAHQCATKEKQSTIQMTSKCSTASPKSACQAGGRRVLAGRDGGVTHTERVSVAGFSGETRWLSKLLSARAEGVSKTARGAGSADVSMLFRSLSGSGVVEVTGSTSCPTAGAAAGTGVGTYAWDAVGVE